MQFLNYSMKPINIFIKCDNEIVTECKEIKFLGFTLDQNCNWKGHTNNVRKRINSFVYALRRLKREANETTVLTAYHGYVGSILRYGLLLWGNSVLVRKVFIAQKKCIRAICGVGPTESCKPLFKKLKLLTLTSMYIYEVGIFVKKHLYLFTTMTEYNKFTPRDPTQLKLPTCKSTLHQQNCGVMAIRIYNRIPKKIRELPLNYFKLKLKTWLIENNFYNINEFL